MHVTYGIKFEWVLSNRMDLETLLVNHHNDGAEDTEEARAEKYSQWNTKHEHEVGMGDLGIEVIVRVQV